MANPSKRADDKSPRRDAQPDVDAEPSIVNIPNALGVVRLVGSAIMVYLAWRGAATAFLGLFVFVLLTDWLDGKLAKLLKLQTTFGARLDSVADAAMYGALLLGTCWLKWSFVVSEAAWLSAAVASYALTTIVGLVKYRRIPSYHTRAAKSCWLLVGLAAISVFTDWSVWPARLAVIGVVITNLEATLISLMLPRWEPNVTSIYHALRDHTGAEPSATDRDE